MTIIQSASGAAADYGIVYTSGAIHLHKCDYMNLLTLMDSQLWLSMRHQGTYNLKS